MHKLLSAVNKIILDKHIDDIVYTNNSMHIDQTFMKEFGFNYFKALPNPPLNSGKQTLLELKELSTKTNSLTPEQVQLVTTVDTEPLTLFRDFLSQKKLIFPEYHFSRLYKILENIILDLKYSFNRPRPEQLASLLNIEINIIHTKTHSTPAYPSGHTAYAELAAYLLSDYYSEYIDDFFKISQMCAEARVLQGVHYPSDNSASRILLDKVYKHIVKYDKKHERISNV